MDACGTDAHVSADVRARVGVGAGAHVFAPTHASAVRSAWTAWSSGAQIFDSAYAFNANIGAWNTVSVSSLAYVCAAFPARRRATAWPPHLLRARSAGHRCGAACCARTASPMRPRVRTLVGARLRVARRVVTAVFDTHVCMHTFIHLFLV